MVAGSSAGTGQAYRDASSAITSQLVAIRDLQRGVHQCCADCFLLLSGSYHFYKCRHFEECSCCVDAARLFFCSFSTATFMHKM